MLKYPDYQFIDIQFYAITVMSPVCTRTLSIDKARLGQRALPQDSLAVVLKRNGGDARPHT